MTFGYVFYFMILKFVVYNIEFYIVLMIFGLVKYNVMIKITENENIINIIIYYNDYFNSI